MWILLAEQKSEGEKFRLQASNLRRGRAINTSGWGNSTSSKWWADAKADMFFQREVYKSKDGEESIVDTSDALSKIVSRDWKRILSQDVIWGSVVPERSLISQGLKRMTTPSRERIGIELFIARTNEERGFWFLSDYTNLIALNPKLISRLFREHHPFSRVVTDLVKTIHNRREITPEAVNDFVKKCSRRLNIKPNGIDEISKLPLKEVPEQIWGLLGLGPIDSEASESPHYWIPSEEPPEMIMHDDEEKEATGGFLRPVGLPIVMAHIPLAYIVAQRFFDDWRVDETWMNHPKQILDWIEEDLRWCPGGVSQLDEWWEGVVAQERGGSSGSVTRLR
jgi:hypothetical protein